MLDLHEGTVVYFKETSGFPAGTGVVRGFASTPMAIVGRFVIIEVDVPIPGYPYSCVSLSEISLEIHSKQ